MKFELQYEWTLPQIFFCGYRVLLLFYHNLEGAHDIKCGEKQLEMKFCWFQGLILPQAATEDILQNKSILKKIAISTGKHTKTPRGFHVETTWKRSFPRRLNAESAWCVCSASVSLYTATLLKKRLWYRGFPVNICKIFKSTSFKRFFMYIWITQTENMLDFFAFV